MFSVLFIKFNQKQLLINFHIIFLPFDEISFNWLLNYLYQMVFDISAAIYLLAYISAVLLSMNHACWKLDNLILFVKRLQLSANALRNGTLNGRLVNRQIEDIVKESYQFMHWREKVQDFLELIFLIEFSCLSFIMCTISFALFGNPGTSFLIYMAMIAVLSQLFTYCWMGTRVNDRIEQLAAEIYDVKWYLMSTSQQKDILLILIMAENMKGFNGIFNEVNMETFKKVIDCKKNSHI